VSSCCSVISEADDFGEYTPRDGFFKVWNSARFKQARGLFSNKKPSSSGKSASRPTDQTLIRVGAGLDRASSSRKRSSLPLFNDNQSNAAPSEDRIICHTCPIPDRMNEALETVEQTAAALLQSFHQELSPSKKARLLFAYMLMGMPNRRRYLRGFLSYGAAHFRVFAQTLAHGMLNSVPRPR
jgi:hypothetical protein